MCKDTISSTDLERFPDHLKDIIHRMKSLDDLEHWFRSQACIDSISTAPYVIETAPPQKEFSVVFKMDDGSKVTKIVDIILYPNQAVGLAGMYDPT